MQMEIHRSISITLEPTQLILASTDISDEASRYVIDDPGCGQRMITTIQN
jgi:hypothetical protein